MDDEADRAAVVPVLVGKKLTINHDGKERIVYDKFDFPRLDEYPDEPHNVTKPCHIPKKSNDTVRAVMKRLFSLQGIFLTDTTNLTGLIAEILDVLSRR